MLAQIFLLSTAVMLSGPSYKCKDAAGNWTEAACTGQAAPKPSAYAISEQQKEQQKQEAAEMDYKWTALCESEGGNWGNKCVQRQRDDYEHMNNIFMTSAKGSDQAKKASLCLAKWLQMTTSTIDATMWRYCYYH